MIPVRRFSYLNFYYAFILPLPGLVALQQRMSLGNNLLDKPGVQSRIARHPSVKDKDASVLQPRSPDQAPHALLQPQQSLASQDREVPRQAAFPYVEGWEIICLFFS